MPNSTHPTIAVIGLGYVGLPLAVALARSFETIGLDIDGGRVAELKSGHDRTGEVDGGALDASSLTLTADPGEARARRLHHHRADAGGLEQSARPRPAGIGDQDGHRPDRSSALPDDRL